MEKNDRQQHDHCATKQYKLHPHSHSQVWVFRVWFTSVWLTYVSLYLFRPHAVKPLNAGDKEPDLRESNTSRAAGASDHMQLKMEVQLLFSRSEILINSAFNFVWKCESNFPWYIVQPVPLVVQCGE